MDFTLYDILVQGIGVIGIIASIMSFQCEKHKKLIFFRTVNELFFAAQYCLLGAYTGMTMNLIGCVRNVVFAKMVKKNKNTIPVGIVFSVGFLIFMFFTWAGFKSVLSGAAKVLSTFAYGCSNTFLVRIIIFVTSTSWLIYNYLVKSYAGCICEFFTLCSIIIGIIRIDCPKLRKN